LSSVKKSSVYTKTGDKGHTSLVGGQRVSKGDLRLHVYGELDELNCCVGQLRVLFAERTPGYIEEEQFLLVLQQNLFQLGSLFACEADQRQAFHLPVCTIKDVQDLEQMIDRLDGQLDPLRNFVLPGSGILNAQAHLCRVICRRLERNMVQYLEVHPEEIPDQALAYINRLSDYFFVLSRYCSHCEKEEEIKWIPQRSRL
jgi:cob(I)alamin adenosyltransferase